MNERLSKPAYQSLLEGSEATTVETILSPSPYYNHLDFSNYDIVIHSEVSEPVIQYSMNLKVKYMERPRVQQVIKQIYYLSQDGRLQLLDSKQSKFEHLIGEADVDDAIVLFLFEPPEDKEVFVFVELFNHGILESGKGFRTHVDLVGQYAIVISLFGRVIEEGGRDRGSEQNVFQFAHDDVLRLARKNSVIRKPASSESIPDSIWVFG